MTSTTQRRVASRRWLALLAAATLGVLPALGTANATAEAAEPGDNLRVAIDAPTDVAPGSLVLVHVSVTNAGTADSSAFGVGVLDIGSGPVVSAPGALLAGPVTIFRNDSLAEGATADFTVRLRAPATTAAGGTIALVVPDRADSYALDNVTATTTRTRPELRTVGAPPVGEEGGSPFQIPQVKIGRFGDSAVLQGSCPAGWQVLTEAEDLAESAWPDNFAPADPYLPAWEVNGSEYVTARVTAYDGPKIYLSPIGAIPGVKDIYNGVQAYNGIQVQLSNDNPIHDETADVTFFCNPNPS